MIKLLVTAVTALLLHSVSNVQAVNVEGGEESSASEFIIGFPVNFVTNVVLRLYVTTREPDPVPFTVETVNGIVFSGVATNTSTRVVFLNNALQVLDNNDRNKGVRVYAGNKNIVVYGGSFNRSGFTDTFLALPCTRQVSDYEYFAITYDENVDYYNAPSHILLVGCENDTVINTGSQTINLNKMETYLIANTNDLTGTRVVSNKPLSFFSGHRCAFVSDRCGYLLEQLPSTAHWGTHFLTASLAGQNNGDAYRILASKPSTTVTQYCSTQSSPTVHELPSAGSWTMITNPDNSFCSFQSNNPLLMVQYLLDENTGGIEDTSMIIIPSIKQYDNNYLLNAINNFSTNFITIFVPPEYYQPENIFVDDDNVAPWTSIGCGDSEVCGYAAFVELNVGDHRVYHTDMSARIGVIAYGFNSVAYGHVAGLEIAKGIPEVLQGMLQMLEKLSCESNNRHWKINAIKDKIESVQYDFVSLKQRLVLLESANTKIMNNPHTCAKYAQTTADDLADIKTSLDEASATLGRVEGFLHPCSGSGWRQVVNFDMTDPDINCSLPWVEITTSTGRRSCGRSTDTGADGSCDSVTILDMLNNPGEPYSEVCGKVRGYQKGLPQAFQAYIDSLSSTPLVLEQAFVDGLVLTRVDPDVASTTSPEHIWTFAAGALQEVGNPSVGTASHCPCLEGEVDFANRGQLPDFLDGHYFCESGLANNGGTAPDPGMLTDIEVNDPLWDGLSCAANSDCCNFGAPPHFTRVLDGAKAFNIVARLCFGETGAPMTNADIGIELIEIYVR